MLEPSPFNVLEKDKQTPPIRRGQMLVAKKKEPSVISKTVAKYVPPAAQYILFFSGLVAFTFGWWMIYHPLGPIVGGATAVFVSTILRSDEPSK